MRSAILGVFFVASVAFPLSIKWDLGVGAPWWQSVLVGIVWGSTIVQWEQLWARQRTKGRR